MQPQGYALITGASSGIGEEFARQLAAQGWSLILVARSQDKLEKVRGELMSAHMGIDVVAIPLDLTTAGAPADLFQRTQAAHLDVDCSSTMRASAPLRNLHRSILIVFARCST